VVMEHLKNWSMTYHRQKPWLSDFHKIDSAMMPSFSRYLACILYACLLALSS
jgi:hypothetical protein